MTYDKEGKLNYFARRTIDVLNEFNWSGEDMADAIAELREQLEDMQDKLDKAQSES